MALRRMKAWRKGARHLPKKLFFQRLKRNLIGHYNNYYVRGISHSEWSFYTHVIRNAKKWIAGASATAADGEI